MVVGDPCEADEVCALLERGPGRIEVDRAASLEGGFAKMTAGAYDAHLVGERLGERCGLELLRAYREAGDGAPVLLLGGPRDRALDLAAMEAGAAGFLERERLDPELLERSIRYAVAARRQENALRRVREELQERVEERSISLGTMNAALAAEVTERRRAELKLRDVDRRKNEFLATLAHELRNPLAPIRHATEMLARLGDGPEDRARAAEARTVIERQVSHLVRLVDDLLDVSRVSHGKVGLRPERVELASIVESALEAARPLLVSRGHTLHVTVPETPVFVHGDPVRLAQILTNLLSNAASYTDPGGTVRVEAAREGGMIVVRVVDSGIGIPPEELSHIFTMFGQTTEARGADHGGLGIGLALAKQLAQLHGGTLTASSEGRGKGSTFTLRLPLEARPGKEAATPVVPATGPPSAATPKQILVVDDNVDAASTLADLLALSGHETHVAHDGPSAVDSALRLRPDVALVDIGLPGFSGLEVARHLRHGPSLEGLLLVALSGWVQPDDLARSREAGFDLHLAKPVDVETLERLLARTAGVRRAS